jgi:60 kDa SS-A/Ro ribonucleoprotein
MQYANHFNRQSTPQTEQADPRQVANNAGGFTFQVDCWKQLERFIALGTEGGTYYVGERALTRENAKVVDECLALDPARTIQTIVNISKAGRAPKNDQAVFALAMAVSHANPLARSLGVAALGDVCRIGTHLFQFVAAVDKMRGWGRGLRRAVAGWYASRDAEALMYQAAKYRQRAGWGHRDALRLSHWEPSTPELQAVARWIVGAPAGERSVKRGERIKVGYQAGPLPEYLQAFDELQATDSLARVIELIVAHRFTHEMVPSQWHKTLAVWEALLPHMPATALLRNLGRLTALGMFPGLGGHTNAVAQRLADPAILKKARIHPIAVLIALRTYQRGRGEKGSLSWDPTRAVVDALDAAFYASFDAVEPTGKNILIGLDVSGSMSSPINGCSLSAREATAAMAMAIARTEQNWLCFGFSNQFIPLAISPRQRLDDVIKAISNLPFQTTDCSLPMVYAQKNKLEVDVFHVWTDNETYAGAAHPHEALRSYRRQSGRNAKLAVMATTATKFTIADPTDAGMLDVSGFDASVPQVLADFAKE